jgi:hypothetical protein
MIDPYTHIRSQPPKGVHASFGSALQEAWS